MIWNYTDKATLTMKNMTDEELKIIYLKYLTRHFMLTMFIKLKEKEKNLFSKIEGDENTINGFTYKKDKRVFK